MALESVENSIKTCCRATTYILPEDVAKEVAKLKVIKVDRVLNISKDNFQ